MITTYIGYKITLFKFFLAPVFLVTGVIQEMTQSSVSKKNGMNSLYPITF